MTDSHWPLGYSATGLRAGLSRKKNKKDMALFFSHLPTEAGAVFTSNQVKAAPILLSEEHLLKTRGHARAIAVNSGSANAATGEPGLKDARQTARWVSKGLGIDLHQVWV